MLLRRWGLPMIDTGDLIAWCNEPRSSAATPQPAKVTYA
jgi:hypothetical protein